MKKFLLATIVIIAITTSSFAGTNNKVTQTVKNALQSDFGNVDQVEWKVKDDYAAATFTKNNERLQVFYSYTGEQIGTSKAITPDQLPLSAKRFIAKKYGDYTIREAIDFQTATESTFYVAAEKDNKTTILMVSNGNVSILQK